MGPSVPIRRAAPTWGATPTPGQATNVITDRAVARNAPSGPASHDPPVPVQPSEPVQVPSAANST